jgi:TonB family protein
MGALRCAVAWAIPETARYPLRELLPPTLDALTFPAPTPMVLGRLKPSNVLAIDDQLKLASGTIRAATDSTSDDVMESRRDAVRDAHSAAANIERRALMIVVAAWFGARFTGVSAAPFPPAADLTPVAPSTPLKVAPPKPAHSNPVSSATERPAPRPALSSSGANSTEKGISDLTVLREVKPDIPPAIRNKIRGRIYVTVRVLVDSDGNVMGALLENAGPSKYFARLAGETARQWQFAPADIKAPRVWLLRFEFTRAAVAARAFQQ